MTTANKNIHPVFNQILKKSDKEKILSQHAKVIWMTGLSGAGKTTTAQNIEMELNKRGFLTQVLDGDNVRSGINNNLGFSDADRMENIRRIAEVSKLFINCGIICINSFISPTREIRHMAMDVIGRENFIEVYVNASVEVCERRDVKGLYKKARNGDIKNFTGIDAPFEIPEYPDIEINTDIMTVQQSVLAVLDVVLPQIEYEVTE